MEQQVRHIMTDDEKVEAAGHATDMISAMQSLEALCEALYGNEERANAALPVIIEVARSTAERADQIRRLIVN